MINEGNSSKRSTRRKSTREEKACDRAFTATTCNRHIDFPALKTCSNPPPYHALTPYNPKHRARLRSSHASQSTTYLLRQVDESLLLRPGTENHLLPLLFLPSSEQGPLSPSLLEDVNTGVGEYAIRSSERPGNECGEPVRGRGRK